MLKLRPTCLIRPAPNESYHIHLVLPAHASHFFLLPQTARFNPQSRPTSGPSGGVELLTRPTSVLYSVAQPKPGGLGHAEGGTPLPNPSFVFFFVTSSSAASAFADDSLFSNGAGRDAPPPSSFSIFGGPQLIRRRRGEPRSAIAFNSNGESSTGSVFDFIFPSFDKLLLRTKAPSAPRFIFGGESFPEFALQFSFLSLNDATEIAANRCFPYAILSSGTSASRPLPIPAPGSVPQFITMAASLFLFQSFTFSSTPNDDFFNFSSESSFCGRKPHVRQTEDQPNISIVFRSFCISKLEPSPGLFFFLYLQLNLPIFTSGSSIEASGSWDFTCEVFEAATKVGVGVGDAVLQTAATVGDDCDIILAEDKALPLVICCLAVMMFGVAAASLTLAPFTTAVPSSAASSVTAEPSFAVTSDESTDLDSEWMLVARRRAARRSSLARSSSRQAII
ncbi:unnamed protein product [Linum trigynum]